MEGNTDFYEEVKEVTNSSEIPLKKNDCYDCCKGKPDGTLKSKNSLAAKIGNKTVVGLVLVPLALVLVLGVVLASTAYALAEIAKLTAFSSMLESAQMNVSLEVMMYQQLVRDLEDRIQQLQDSSNNTAEMRDLEIRIQQLQGSSNNTAKVVAALDERSSLLDARVANLVSSFNTTHQQLNNSISNVANVLAAYLVPSCHALPPSLPAGYYYILSSTGSAVRQYCPSITTRCGQTGRWRSVANLDMTNSTHQCFSGLTQPSYTNTSLCVKSSNSSGCSSVQLPANTAYESVCGTVTAYQFGTPDAFHSSASIDSPYVEGVSITHGSPRQHIWTFAAAHTESKGRGCSCLRGGDNRPAFVRNDYFCDTGTSTDHGFVFYGDDPLWDGAGCGPTNNCCSFNTPPWFYKELPQNTSDDIELRLCRDSTRSDEDIALETVTIYVK